MLEQLEGRWAPAVYTVDSLLDSDTGTGDAGTLRYVINRANANATGTAQSPDIIQFATGGGTIQVGLLTSGAPLPALGDNFVVVIDATTESGYSGTPLVTIDGTSATAVPDADGLILKGGSSVIKGLSIVGFSGDGVQFDTNDGNTLLSSYIGITPAGVAVPNAGNGITISGTRGNVIGSINPIGDATGLGANVISGNGQAGILIENVQIDTTDSNQIVGNFIGLNPAGTAKIPNGSHGVSIVNSSDTFVGGAASGSANVISGNDGDGVSIRGIASLANILVANFIGTNPAGTAALGNAGNGVVLTEGTRLNIIGGNTPAPGIFKGIQTTQPGKPPDGNVISGNDGNGVLLDQGASQNTLYGNFIGTNLAGLAAIGNALDGVAIINGSNDNVLEGTTFPNEPFIYLNLVSGNGKNGLRITDSNNTGVYANVFGIGDDNNTAIPNGENGVLINGSSTGTIFGGVIPLGNIAAGNVGNGVELADTASGTIIFNTFGGIPAFVDFARGNGKDGILITSTGGGNLIRTSLFSGNLGNGIHITGNASDVQITETIIGMNTNASVPIPNELNGILIDGDASDIAVGGVQLSLAPQIVVSANKANGIAVVGNASTIRVFHSYVGVDLTGRIAHGNTLAGVLIGENAQDVTVGAADPDRRNVISGNLAGGIVVDDQADGVTLIGNTVGSNADRDAPIPNQGNGITLFTSNNVVGGDRLGEDNAISFNTQHGIQVSGGANNLLTRNSIFRNQQAGISLTAGGNANQPAPVLTGALVSNGQVQITGTLSASPSTQYTIEFFASLTSAAGQGETYLGSLTVTTDQNGTVPFVFSGALPEIAGTSFTATATSPTNNTSAFSAAIGLASNANSLYVGSLYGLLLGRAPDASSAIWVNALDAGASPESVVLGIQASVEYLSDQVTGLYARYLNRTPDSAGLQAWTNALLAGATFEQVAAALIGSPEYFALHGSTDIGFVQGIYQDVLGRSPSPEELAGWVGVLNAGVSRTDVAILFLNSTEYRTDLITDDYLTYLGRNPDSAGLSSWLAAMANGATDQQVLAGILGSQEGFARWS